MTTAEKRRQQNREAQRRYRARHPERQLASVRKWQAKNPEKVKATKAAWNAKWRAENPELDRERQRQWAQRNVERRRANERRYRQTERYVIARQKRAAAKRGVTAESVNRRVVFERDSYICQLCGEPTQGKYPDPRSPTIDHIVPLVKGGAHSYANTQCAHYGCNARKGAG